MGASNWSVPETELFDAIRTALDKGEPAAVATIIDVAGSAYRRPGAKMVIPAEGGGTGSITAGCLESEVQSLAQAVIAARTPRVESFDLMGDDDVWGLGVGCNGVLDILLEPLSADYRTVLSAYDAGENIAVCTILDAPTTTVDRWERTYYDYEGGFSTNDWPDWLTGSLEEPAEALADDGRAETLTTTADGEETTVFVDGVAAPPELFIFGTGHDVSPVCELAKTAGFRVTVVGFRGANATEERFPAADRVLSTSPGRFAETLAFDENSYAVVMTHNFVDDQLTVETLLETPVAYIGLMGPGERFEQMRDSFEQPITREANEKLHTPAGLDLGGSTPYQIAHSIVAELLVVENDRKPRHLTDRSGHIHDRSVLQTN